MSDRERSQLGEFPMEAAAREMPASAGRGSNAESTPLEIRFVAQVPAIRDFAWTTPATEMTPAADAAVRRHLRDSRIVCIHSGRRLGPGSRRVPELPYPRLCAAPSTKSDPARCA